MVHAQDLRIGNWILYDGHECRVWGIQYVVPDVAYQVIIDAHKGVGGYDFDGIPLSEEWLIRFGFEILSGKQGYFAETKTPWFVLTKTDDVFRLAFYNTAEINYVHQLQNLYFALTGSELTERKI